MLKILPIQTFLLVGFVTYGVLADSCSLSCVQTVSGCKVCFNQCVSGGQKAYYFQYCSQIQESGHSPTNQSSTLNYDIIICSNSCCDSQLQKFKNSAFRSCVKPTQIQSQTLLIVIIVLVAIFVVLCCIVSGHSKIREKFVECLTRNDAKVQPDKSNSISSNISMSNSIDLSLPSQKKRKLYNFAFNETTCSICLESESNVSSKCGHAYHINCLYQWIIRKQVCPICKSKQMQKVYIFCKKCYKNKMKITLLELPFLGISSLNRFECNQCKSTK